MRCVSRPPVRLTFHGGHRVISQRTQSLVEVDIGCIGVVNGRSGTVDQGTPSLLKESLIYVFRTH